MTLLPVIAQIEKQRNKVQRLVQYCRDLDGTELLVVPIEPEIERIPYPVGAELTRHEVMRQFRHQPFLWLEPDAIPLKKGWLQSITDEYHHAGKPFLLPSLIGSPKGDIASAIGVYPEGAVDLIPKSFVNSSWDGWVYKTLPHAIHFSRLIQHSYCLYGSDGLGVRKHDFPIDKSILRPEAVLFHADPNQTLIPKTKAEIAVSEPAKRQFYHSGDLGDIIAALPTIRQLGGGTLIVGPHCGKGKAPREGVNQERWCAIQPLLAAQSYIKAARFVTKKPQESMLDFSTFREMSSRPPENLAEWQARYIGLTNLDLSPWLTVPASQSDQIIFSRSLRYHNSAFPWQKIAMKHRGCAVFVGLKEEHAAFVRATGVQISMANTPTLLDAAKLISGASFGFYNQSCCFWLAAALGKPAVQESYLGELNSLIYRPYMAYTTSDTEIQHVANCAS